MPERKKQKGFTVWQHGRQWYAAFSIGGRRFQRPCAPFEGVSRGDAEEAARQLVARLTEEASAAAEKRRAESPVVQHQRKTKRKSSSHHQNCLRFHARLVEFFGAKQEVLDLARADVERWVEWLATCERNDKKEGTLSAKTIKEHIDWLASVFNNAGKENPCRGVERPKRTHAESADALEYFTWDELVRLCDVAAEWHRPFYNGFMFFVWTGCRTAEVQGIRRSDLDFKNQIVKITGKGSVRRHLRLSGHMQPAWDALMAELTENPRSDGFIFSQSPTWARKRLEELCRNTFGLDIKTRKAAKHGHPHMLRHTFASLMLYEADPPMEIEYLYKHLGHSDFWITAKIYAHFIAPHARTGYGFAICYKIATKDKGRA